MHVCMYYVFKYCHSVQHGYVWLVFARTVSTCPFLILAFSFDLTNFFYHWMYYVCMYMLRFGNSMNCATRKKMVSITELSLIKFFKLTSELIIFFICRFAFLTANIEYCNKYCNWFSIHGSDRVIMIRLPPSWNRKVPVYSNTTYMLQQIVNGKGTLD